ncbi:hypothetical protein PHMEG_0007967 [Phytophthora megakarya]|uniref:Uncharacterized protein n=1 Tax=Phytophthora megakarya TaxID=4795 RepID=A0A225WL77_9STRA|nr:hypothetical protein PHMEG_0007967 [Phytophthora megakarya]
MLAEFMEPTFEEKIRNRLLTIKQTGGYIGYVGKFKELNRVVRTDDHTAMSGLSDIEIKRKKPNDLNSANQEEFRGRELHEKLQSPKSKMKTDSKVKANV